MSKTEDFRPNAEGEYCWIDTYDCGHTQNVVTMVPVDRQVRVGEPVVCYVCKEAGAFLMRQRTAVEYVPGT